MNERGLRPSGRIVESDWLAPRLRRFGSAVASVVPDGFPAYVRLLHPARDANDVSLSWAEVAAWSGRTMHRLVQFHRITQPLQLSDVRSAPWDGQDPTPGNLPAGLLRGLCATLAQYTDTSDVCWFCLWDGFGWLHGGSQMSGFSSYRDRKAWLKSKAFGTLPKAPPLAKALPLEALNVHRVRLPKRNYLLYEGPLTAATQLGLTAPGGTFFPQSPNLFWPHDRAWCVASEIDLFCTLIAGSESLAHALITDPSLETWRVDAGDPIAYDSDEINT